MKNNILTGLALVCVLAGSTLAIEWNGTVDSDWYNSANWSPATVPGSSDTIAWRYAAVDSATYSPIVISGGTATSGTSTCGIWYEGTASMTITNSATYSITGNLNLQNGAADNAHSPADIVLNLNGGSTMNVSNETQVGRKLLDGTAYGTVTVNIDGAGTTLNQGNIMWFGWGDNRTVETVMNISNGAVANFNAVGGLRIQPDTVNGIFPVINLDGGFININGNRETEIAGWLDNNYLLAYGETTNIVYSYDEISGYTNISSVPEPTSACLLGLSLLGLRLRNKAKK